MKLATRQNLRKHEILKEGLAAGIASGQFAAGERLPSVHALAKQYKVSVAPVCQAITTLCKHGLVERIAGRQGVFVARQNPEANRKVKAVAIVYEGAKYQPDGGASKLFTQIVIENVAEAARRSCVDVRMFAHKPVTVEDEDRELLEIASRYQVVMFPDAAYLHWAKHLAAHGCRVLFAGTNNAYPGVNRVRFDLSTGVADAIDHLAALGHRRIAYMDCFERYLGLPNDKMAGYCRGVSRHGLPATLIPLADEFQIDAYREIARLAAGWRGNPERPTAILARNDVQAMGAMLALQEAGLNVPADISVVGMDDRANAAEASPPLTTIALDHSAAAGLALDWIVQALGEGPCPTLDATVPVRLIVRSSTAAAPQMR